MKLSNRRKFIKDSGTVATAIIAVPTIVSACSRGKEGHVAPSDRINMGVIGAGNMGKNDANKFLLDERVQITTICDVNKRSTGYWNGQTGGRDLLMAIVDKAYTERYGTEYKGSKGIVDFRKVIDDKSIDAVIIATPDHWHAIPVLMATAAKKDIYCQKPLSLTIEEGRAMSNAVKKHDVVFQTGSQQRSNRNFRRICELVKNGRIGELESVHCGLPPGTPDYGKTKFQTDPIPVPKDFDYEMWLGPAPQAAYSPARTFVNYRWILDYSGGQITDWGGHHPDIAQWGMGMELSGPVKIQNAKGSCNLHPIWNTAAEYHFECVYENGVKMTIASDRKFGGVRFNGTEGSVWANRREHNASDPKILDSVIGENEIHLYKSDNHYRNFIDCVLSREETVAPAEVAHRSITLSHLGNIAIMLGEDLDWDPVSEKVLNNDQANKMLGRTMREPWASVYKKFLV